VRRSMSEILEDEGYAVIRRRRRRGVEQAIARSPDAIFLDIWLPGVDGSRPSG